MIERTECPVCEGTNIQPCWSIPFAEMKEPQIIDGFRMRCLPYSTGTVHHYSRCACGTIFDREVNPAETGDVFHKARAEAREEWESYTERVAVVMPYIKDFDTVIDVACGGGQNLIIFKEQGINWKRSIGIEASQPCADYINWLGFEGYCRKIEDPFPEIEDGVADLVLFFEAFEHVDSPPAAFRNMARWLKPSGIIYFEVQAAEGRVPIRPGENILAPLHAIKGLLDKNGVEIIRSRISTGKWFIIGEKT